MGPFAAPRRGETIEEAAANYDALLREFGPIDLIHLGLGPDGHTASLFPGSAAVDEADARCRQRRRRPSARPAHVHLSRNRARRTVVFTVAGEGKRAAFDRVRAGDDVPAARGRSRPDHLAGRPRRRRLTFV